MDIAVEAKIARRQGALPAKIFLSGDVHSFLTGCWGAGNRIDCKIGVKASIGSPAVAA